MTAPTAPQNPFSIAVAGGGGGIGGLALAIGLRHQDVPVHIYEAAPAFAEVGAGVAFGRNAMRAMSLIEPAIEAGFQRRATTNGWRDKQKTWFDVSYGMDSRNGNGKKAGDLICPVTTAWEPAQGSIHRARFLDELVGLVPEGCASFGKRVEVVEETEGGARLRFRDGTSAEHTAVIGCDGIKSRTRKIVLGEGRAESTAVFTGKYAYRGLVPMEKAVGLLGEELAQNGQMCMKASLTSLKGILLMFLGQIWDIMATSSPSPSIKANP